MTPIILLTATRVYDGIMRYEARESSEPEILPLVEKGYDFKGQRYRIFVLPINCTLTKEEAYGWAVKWATLPFESHVDWAEYSRMQSLLTGAKKRNDQYQRKRWKPKKKQHQDRQPNDLSSELE